MRPSSEVKGDDQVPSVDGIEVEESGDDDTIRAFMGTWRKRVGEEYLRWFVEKGADVDAHRASAVMRQ